MSSASRTTRFIVVTDWKGEGAAWTARNSSGNKRRMIARMSFWCLFGSELAMCLLLFFVIRRSYCTPQRRCSTTSKPSSKRWVVIILTHSEKYESITVVKRWPGGTNGLDVICSATDPSRRNTRLSVCMSCPQLHPCTVRVVVSIVKNNHKVIVQTKDNALNSRQQRSDLSDKRLRRNTLCSCRYSQYLFTNYQVSLNVRTVEYIKR